MPDYTEEKLDCCPHGSRDKHTGLIEEMNKPKKESSDDPWKHRSAGMRCRTCMWFVPKFPDGEEEQPPGPNRLGRCRRHAPTMNGFPAVYGCDWCGDHKVDENKA